MSAQVSAGHSVFWTKDSKDSKTLRFQMKIQKRKPAFNIFIPQLMWKLFILFQYRQLWQCRCRIALFMLTTRSDAVSFLWKLFLSQQQVICTNVIERNPRYGEIFLERKYHFPGRSLQCQHFLSVGGEGTENVWSLANCAATQEEENTSGHTVLAISSTLCWKQ